MKGGRSISNCAISGPRRWWSRASLLRRQGDIGGEDAGWTPLDRVGLHDGWHLAPPFCRWAVGQHCPDMAFLHREPGGDRRMREREREGRVTTKCESFLYCGVLLQQKRRDSGVPGGGKTHTTKKKVANGVIIAATIAVL